MTAPTFFSVEYNGFLTVSDLFANIYTQMTGISGVAGSQQFFDVINVSHPYDPSPGGNGGSLRDLYDTAAERYPTITIRSNTIPDMKTWKANVRATGSTYKPGDKLFIAKADAAPTTILGVDQPQPYVVVTKTGDATTGVFYTDPATAVPAKILEVSDVVNGAIGFSGTDYPVFDQDFDISSLGAPDPIDAIINPGGPINIYQPLKESTLVPGTPGTTKATDVSLCFYRGMPDFYSFTLEAAGFVDPLNSNTRISNLYQDDNNTANRQPWRVQFVISGPQQALGSIATPLQMAYDPRLGRVSIAKITNELGAVVDNVGSLGAWQPSGAFTQSNFTQGFVNRTQRVGLQDRTYPLSYILTIAERGFFLGIWEGNWSTQLANAGQPNNAASNFFNWVLVQRPADRNNGRILLTGKAPVFAINGVDYIYYKSVVREADVLHPSSGPTLQSGTGKLIISTRAPYKVLGNIDLANNLMTQFSQELEIGSSIWDPDTNTYVGTIGSIFDDRTAFLDGKPPTDAIAKLDLAKTSLARTKSILTSNLAKPGVIDGTALVNFNYIGPNQTPYRIYADKHSDGSHMLFNSENQVALTEDKTYLLTFPHNLTTPRFRYTEELDLMGTTSSDVVRTGQEIQFSTYGEWGPRTYRAMPGSDINNTGLRVATLVRPQGPKLLGIQTTANLGIVVDHYDPAQKYWTSSTIDPVTGLATPCVEPLPPGGNLSMAGYTTAALAWDPTLNSGAGGQARPGPVYAGQLWDPLLHNIQINGLAIPAAWPGHGQAIEYSITRNLAQITALGLQIDPVTGVFGVQPTVTNIQDIGFIQDTIIPFTITIKNDSQDGEVPPGQNSIDVYILYKPTV
jgi:hypothetical protein